MMQVVFAVVGLPTAVQGLQFRPMSQVVLGYDNLYGGGICFETNRNGIKTWKESEQAVSLNLTGGTTHVSAENGGVTVYV